MSKFWAFLTSVHSLSGPALTLLYPLYASVVAIETTSKVDDEQWLAYWIIYSFLTLLEMLLLPLLEWIPIWYDMKLLFVAWLVLPQFRGSAYIYNKFVRKQMKQCGVLNYLQQSQSQSQSQSLSHSHDDKSPNTKAKPKPKGKKKFVDFIVPKKVSQ